MEVTIKLLATSIFVVGLNKKNTLFIQPHYHFSYRKYYLLSAIS